MLAAMNPVITDDGRQIAVSLHVLRFWMANGLGRLEPKAIHLICRMSSVQYEMLHISQQIFV